MGTRQFGMISFPNREQFIRIVQRKIFLFLLHVFLRIANVSLNTQRQSSASIKFGSLALGRLETILESFHLHSLLVFKVLFQDGNRSTANRRDKIRMCPQGRQSAFHLRKLLTKQTRTATFDSFHELMDTPLRINFTKVMDVIGHHFKFQNLTSQLFRHLLDDLFQTFVHTAHEHLAAILRTKDNMLLAGV